MVRPPPLVVVVTRMRPVAVTGMVVRITFLHVGLHDPTLLEAVSVLDPDLQHNLVGTPLERHSRA